MTSRCSVLPPIGAVLGNLGFCAVMGVASAVAVEVPAVAHTHAATLRPKAVERTPAFPTARDGGIQRFGSAGVPANPRSESVMIYDNTTGPGAEYYSGQAGQEAVDDVHATGSGYLRRIGFEYVESDSLATDLEALVTVYDNPWGLDIDLVRLAGPYVVTGLLPGRHFAHLDVFDWVVVGPDLWIGVQFTRRSTGLVINETPSVGSSHDYYLENGNFFYFGGDPEANFSLQVEVGGPAQTLSLDVHPGSCPNPINVKSQGTTSAAILGAADVIVREIDTSSILLEGVAPIGTAYEDVATPASGDTCSCTTAGKDRFEDLTLKFDTQELVAALGTPLPAEERVVRMTGRFLDGTPFVSQDCIVLKGLAATIANPPTILTVLTTPFDRVQELEYEVSERSQVSLTIYDVRGRVVQAIVREVQPTGTYLARWDASDSPGGVYFCRLRVGESLGTLKLVLIR